MDLLDHRNSYGGVKAEYFIELLQNAIEEAENACCDYENTLKQKIEMLWLVSYSSCTATVQFTIYIWFFMLI